MNAKPRKKLSSKHMVRRLMATLMLHHGDPVTHAAKVLCTARSSIGRWINWFTLYGCEGLKSLPPGRPLRWLEKESILCTLPLFVQHSPQEYGYLRSRWRSVLFTIETNRIFNTASHSTTMRKWLSLANLVWRRAAPTLHIRAPKKTRKCQQ